MSAHLIQVDRCCNIEQKKQSIYRTQCCLDLQVKYIILLLVETKMQNMVKKKCLLQYKLLVFVWTKWHWCITQEFPRDAYAVDKGNVLKGNKWLNWSWGLLEYLFFFFVGLATIYWSWSIKGLKISWAAIRSEAHAGKFKHSFRISRLTKVDCVSPFCEKNCCYRAVGDHRFIEVKYIKFNQLWSIKTEG